MTDDKPVSTSYNLPSNSRKSKAAKDEKPKVERITTGAVVERKKSLGSRIAETFTGDDAKSVGGYILFDVILPAAKTMISDAVSQGIERMLFGSDYRSTSRGGSRQGYVPYNRISTTTRNDNDRPGGRNISSRARSVHDFKEIILESRAEATEVLEKLNDLIDQYEQATISDLYDLVGVTGAYTDDKWGWYDLRGAGIQRIPQGYLLNLPKTESLV